MRYFVFLILSAMLVMPMAHNASAAGYCPSQKNGKCPSVKKNSRKKSDYTEDQRKKFMEQARALCKKKYGAPSTVYRVDYSRLRVICNQPAY